MVRSIIILISVLAIIASASIFEKSYFNSKMEYFDTNLDVIISQTENEEDASDNLQTLTDWWKNEKKIMHAFISHNEIKDIDGLMIESKEFIENAEYVFASAKLKRLDDMIVTLPDGYSFCFGNIF